jgi:teichuronic acid biosynthesis glycosyltransferase TuaC
MKILFVNSANKKNRISPFILSQAVSIQQNGLEVDFFSLDQGGIKGYIKHAIKLRKVLKENKYDVIHAHYALMGFISSFARGKEKLIVSLMGCDILGSYRSDGSLKWSEQFIVIAAKLFARFSWDIVILKSANMIPKLLPKTKFNVIPNGVDISLFSVMDRSVCREKLNFLKNTIYILFPTNPDRPEKNFLLAKTAVELLRGKLDSNVELIVVHKLSYEELIIYYNAVDVCILTSRSEGSPNVIKECMACNVPIVSTDVGDVKELISGTDGCFISVPEPSEFAEKIHQAIMFNGKTDGREKIKNLEINLIANKIIAVYDSVLI